MSAPIPNSRAAPPAPAPAITPILLSCGAIGPGGSQPSLQSSRTSGPGNGGVAGPDAGPEGFAGCGSGPAVALHRCTVIFLLLSRPLLL